MNQKLMAIAAIVLLAMGYLYFPRSEANGKSGLTPVTGLVTVNGEPAAGVAVTLIPVGQDPASTDPRPTGITDATGKFQLTTVGNNDGAAAGEYSAVFFWPDDVDQPRDRFQGRLLNPEKSTFRATVGNESLQLEPFAIQLPASALLPAAFDFKTGQRITKPAAQK